MPPRPASRGHYQFDDLTPGHYTVTVNARGHGLASETVVVSGEGARCDFVFRRTANLRGTVHGRDGRPARDARVVLLDATGDVVATRATADDGTYSFAELADRQYTLIATGYPPVATPITLNGDSHNRFDLFLGNGTA